MIRGEKGSLLIELIIGLSILSIIFSMVDLRLDTVYKYRLNQEALEFKKDIDNLRINSLKKNINSSLLINSSTAYSMRRSDSKKLTNKKVSSFKINTSIREVRFNRNGAPVNANTIKLEHRYGTWEIRISPVTGKTNLVK